MFQRKSISISIALLLCLLFTSAFAVTVKVVCPNQTQIREGYSLDPGLGKIGLLMYQKSDPQILKYSNINEKGEIDLPDDWINKGVVILTQGFANDRYCDGSFPYGYHLQSNAFALKEGMTISVDLPPAPKITVFCPNGIKIREGYDSEAHEQKGMFTYQKSDPDNLFYSDVNDRGEINIPKEWLNEDLGVFTQGFSQDGYCDGVAPEVDHLMGDFTFLQTGMSVTVYK